jgi:hypothetical protein
MNRLTEINCRSIRISNCPISFHEGKFVQHISHIHMLCHFAYSLEDTPWGSIHMHNYMG